MKKLLLIALLSTLTFIFIACSKDKSPGEKLDKAIDDMHEVLK